MFVRLNERPLLQYACLALGGTTVLRLLTMNLPRETIAVRSITIWAAGLVLVWVSTRTIYVAAVEGMERYQHGSVSRLRMLLVGINSLGGGVLHSFGPALPDLGFSIVGFIFGALALAILTLLSGFAAEWVGRRSSK